MIISKNGKIYNIKKLNYENSYQHIKRSWIIINSGLSVQESIVWQSINDYNCSYDPYIMENINEKTKNSKY